MLDLNKTMLLISAGRPDQFPSDGIPQIVFSGRSNVGKSSLINTLLNRKALARVSGSPGKTVTVNFYGIDGKLIFADLPGYGFAKRSYGKKEDFSSLTDSYLTNCADIALVLQLIDVKVGVTDDDRMMLGWLSHSKIPFCVVATKVDKLNKTELGKQISSLCSDPDIGAAPVIPFSSLKGTGRDEVWRHIYGFIK